MASTPIYRGNVDPSREFRRGLTAAAVAGVTGDTLRDVAARLYGKDAGEVVTKAAVTITSTSTVPALVGVTVGTFLRAARPKSAAAQLIDMGPQFDLQGRGSISIPRFASDFPQGAWVGEGDPSPVLSGSLTSTVLTPKKLMALSALTLELSEASAENAEKIISDALAEAVGRKLDATMFSTDAATSVAPAGLLNGIAPTAATAGGGTAAMAGDLRLLTTAVHNAGAGADLVVIAAAAQAMSMKVFASGQLDLPVIVAPNLASGVVIVLDINDFASAFTATPRIEIVDSALIHLDNSSPQQIGTAGTPNVTAAPAREAFQSGLKVIRVVLKVAYSMRTPALAWTSGATW